MYDITASIVAYKNDYKKIRTVLRSILGTKHSVKVFLIDNSPTKKLETELKSELADRRIDYLHRPQNLGFGQGHNTAIRSAVLFSTYHIVLNPDLEFSPAAIDNMFSFMEANPGVGQLLPKVYCSNGSLQSCKLLPRPVDLFSRRFFSRFKWADKLNQQYEISEFNYNTCLNLPNLSGCFMFFRSSCLAATGGFDKRYFMYLEDVDLTRRIHSISQTIYYPFATITHEYQKGSYNNTKLLFYHIASAIKYFFKWGWFIDSERVAFNNDVKRAIKSGNKTNFTTIPESVQDHPIRAKQLLVSS